jgi:hypothetical protein
LRGLSSTRTIEIRGHSGAYAANFERPAPTEIEFSELVWTRFEKTPIALDKEVGFSFMDVACKEAYAKYLAASSAEEQEKILEDVVHEGLMGTTSYAYLKAPKASLKRWL